MKKRRIQKSGLDELMIVNPAGSESGGLAHRSSASPQHHFLGLDGCLYCLAGFGGDDDRYGSGGLAEQTVFIGQDGSLYMPIGPTDA